MNYLAAYNLKIGLLINFPASEVQRSYSNMKLFAIAVLALLSLFSSAQAQLKDEALTPLFQALSERKWDVAHTLANDILLKHDTEQTNAVAFTRYIALYTGAAMVADGKLTYDQFTPYAHQFVGKALIMAAHPTTADTSVQLALNTTVLKRVNDVSTAYVACTSEKRDQIYSYEMLKFATDFDHTQYEGQKTRTAGYLSAVILNPEKQTNWIMQLELDKATIHLWQNK